MAVDYTLPINTTNYTDELAQLRENIVAAMTMDYSGATALADTTIRYNRATAAFEEYDLGTTTWNTLFAPFASGTTMLFGDAAAPTGWTRSASWADNAMICVAATGTPAAGGSANPQSAHLHTGGNHTHTLNAHTHTIGAHTHATGAHTHGPGDLRFRIHKMSWGSAADTSLFEAYDTNGTTLLEIFSGIADTTASGTGNYLYMEPPSIVVGDETFYFYSSIDDSRGVSGSSSGTTSSSAAYTSGTPSNNNTSSAGAVVTGQNTAPLFQEVIAAIKD